MFAAASSGLIANLQYTYRQSKQLPKIPRSGARAPFFRALPLDLSRSFTPTRPPLPSHEGVRAFFTVVRQKPSSPLSPFLSTPPRYPPPFDTPASHRPSSPHRPCGPWCARQRARYPHARRPPHQAPPDAVLTPLAPCVDRHAGRPPRGATIPSARHSSVVLPPLPMPVATPHPRD